MPPCWRLLEGPAGGAGLLYPWERQCLRHRASPLRRGAGPRRLQPMGNRRGQRLESRGQGGVLPVAQRPRETMFPNCQETGSQSRPQSALLVTPPKISAGLEEKHMCGSSSGRHHLSSSYYPSPHVTLRSLWKSSLCHRAHNTPAERERIILRNSVLFLCGTGLGEGTTGIDPEASCF